MKLTDEQVNDLRSKHGWAKETIRAIEAEVLRLNGITGDGRGEAVTAQVRYFHKDHENGPQWGKWESEDDPYSARFQKWLSLVKEKDDSVQIRWLYAIPPQQQQSAPGAVPDGFVLVPVELTDAMAEWVTAPRWQSILAAAPKPQEPV